MTAGAVEWPGKDSTVSALHEYAQTIDGSLGKGSSPYNDTIDAARLKITDASYMALRAFAEQIGSNQPKPTQSAKKFAEADYAIDALREFFQRNNTPQSPAAPAEKKPIAGGKQPSVPIVATTVGSQVCAGCHAGSATQFNHTLMGRLARTQKGKFECENCHGPGSEHVKGGGGRGVGGLISFRPDDPSHTAEESNSICLACHERGDRTYWNGSTHETRGMMCSNCHTVMKQVSRKSSLKTAFEPETCYQCHKERRAETYFSSHMATREGKITCSNCHNPHGSATESMLRANSINDNCYKCHAEKRGPFRWEHNPVRENCLNCHEAHGSTKPALLKVLSPKLCAECHGFDHGTNLLGPANSRFVFNKGCTNCHSKIHGSNHPSGMIFLR